MSITKTIRISNQKIWKDFIHKLEQENGTSKGYIGSTIEYFIKQYTNSEINAVEDRRLEEHNKSLEDQLQKLEEENKVLQLNIKNTSKLHQQSMDLIENIQEELTKQQKDTRTARNDYKHSQEVLNKLQTEYNQLQKENKKYIYCIAQIQKMSLLERLLNKYPEEIKELNEKKT